MKYCYFFKLLFCLFLLGGFVACEEVAEAETTEQGDADSDTDNDTNKEPDKDSEAEKEPDKPALLPPMHLSSPYVETMSDDMKIFNCVEDYGMSSDSEEDQSPLLQTAINTVSAYDGGKGGKLYIPAGTYRFSEVDMESNVHILVDKDAVLKPYWDSLKRIQSMLSFAKAGDDKKEFITKPEGERYVENCSIRCFQGGANRFTVDYSDVDESYEGRFIRCCMVHNFHISGFNIKDNYTKFCGVIFVATAATTAPNDAYASYDKDARTLWGIDYSRPTNGEIKDVSITGADSGYGMCQMHGAKNLYFENLYSEGGITLRLESGAGGPHSNMGVFDIQAKNVKNKGGLACVMMNPHNTKDGVVRVDGVYAESAQFGVLIRKGFMDSKHTDENKTAYPYCYPGTYSNDSRIDNVFVTCGDNAQIDDSDVWIYENEKYVASLQKDPHNSKSFIGHSICAVYDDTSEVTRDGEPYPESDYDVTVQNIVATGFDSDNNKVLYYEDIENADDRDKNKWNLLRKYGLRD